MEKDSRDLLLNKDYFLLYPNTISSSWNVVSDFLLKSDFIEYLFYLILSSKYENILVYWTQFFKKDFNVNNTLNFEFENSWDLLISNFESIKMINNLLPSEYKKNIWFFTTPLRKFTKIWGWTYDLSLFEKKYEKKFKEEHAIMIKNIEKNEKIPELIKKTLSQSIVIKDQSFINEGFNLLKKSIENSKKNNRDDLIIKTYINKNISRWVFEYLKWKNDFVDFLYKSYKDYIDMRNSKITLWNNNNFNEYLENKYGWKQKFQIYIKEIKEMFKSVKYEQRIFNSKWTYDIKKLKWIETYYINKRNLNINNLDNIYLKYNLSKDTSWYYTNSFVSFDKKYIKQLSIQNLSFN